MKQLNRDNSDLIRQAMEGDIAAFEKLVLNYQDKMFAVANTILENRYDAQDVVQEAFIKAFLSIKNLKTEYAFYQWLLRITINKALDEKNRNTNRNRSLLRENCFSHTVNAGKDYVETLVSNNQIRQALTSLSPAHRAVLILREVEGLSYAEIGDILNIPVGTVRSRLNHARLRLKESFLELEL